MRRRRRLSHLGQNRNLFLGPKKHLPTDKGMTGRAQPLDSSSTAADHSGTVDSGVVKVGEYSAGRSSEANESSTPPSRSVGQSV